MFLQNSLLSSLSFDSLCSCLSLTGEMTQPSEFKLLVTSLLNAIAAINSTNGLAYINTTSKNPAATASISCVETWMILEDSEPWICSLSRGWVEEGWNW